MRQAAYAAIVGESFAAGNLPSRAHDHNVALLTTNNVIDLLRLHKNTPLNLVKMRELFSPGAADKAVDELRHRHEQDKRCWQFIAEIVDKMAEFQQRDHEPPFILNRGNLFVAMASANLMPTGNLDGTLIQQAFTDAVAFLANPNVGVLKEVGEALQLTMSPATARQRIRALARFLEITSS